MKINTKKSHEGGEWANECSVCRDWFLGPQGIGICKECPEPIKPAESELKCIILDYVADLVSDFLYYDRKDDEDFGHDEVKTMKKIMEPEEIAAEFLKHLKNSWTND